MTASSDVDAELLQEDDGRATIQVVGSSTEWVTSTVVMEVRR